MGVAETEGSIVVVDSSIPFFGCEGFVGTAVARTLTGGWVGTGGGVLSAQAAVAISKSIAANPIAAANLFFIGVLH
ncbi:MAG: hypothetical protein ACE1Y2_06270 [Stenotrophomonas maltophilia]